MQHAIPVLAAAGQRKRSRTQEPTAPVGPSSMQQLQGFLRSQIRARGMPSFQGDFVQQEPARVEASAVAPPAAIPAPPVESQSTAGTRMLGGLRQALRIHQ